MFRTLSLSLLLACSCGLANAQDDQQVGPPISVDDGGVSGTLTSFDGDTLGPPVDLFTVPEGTDFALTAACLFGSQAELGSTAPEPILIARGNGCVNYYPGLIIIEGETIQCSGPGTCTVTGILVELPGASDEMP